MSEKQLVHKDKNWEAVRFPISILMHDFVIKLNIGSTFRLADALGCEHIYLTGNTPVPPDRKITKTSRSAEKYVPYSYSENPIDVVSQLKELGYKIIALELTTLRSDIAELELKSDDKICLILGSEKKGVNQELLDASDLTVHIPMYGELSSLNVATAAGIALYGLTNSLRPLY